MQPLPEVMHSSLIVFLFSAPFLSLKPMISVGPWISFSACSVGCCLIHGSFSKSCEVFKSYSVEFLSFKMVKPL